jgi:hypothetical protein
MVSVLYGTTILGVKTFQEVILAADTKLSRITGKDTSDAGRIRKIEEIGSLFFAPAGLYGGASSRFSLSALITDACEGNPPIAEKVARFATAVRQPLIELVLNIKQEHSDYFRTDLNSKVVFQIAFGAFEAGHPHLYTVACKSTHEGKSLEIKIDRFERGEFAVLGQHSEIKKFLAANPGYLFPDGWRRSIENLIGLEAARYPEKVALPVDILRIDRSGASWL